MHQHADSILQGLKQAYPGADCALAFKSPLELLVATILSAQCTDARVNKVTPELFRQFQSAADYADVPIEYLEKLIHSTGFYRNKAKSIQNSCREIVARFNGNVPDTMEGLISLPGVGRKTANVILSNTFGRNEGIVVDTHVFRVSRRLGLAEGKTPEKVELELMELFPPTEWSYLGHALILHGRQICIARKPRCGGCGLNGDCRQNGQS